MSKTATSAIGFLLAVFVIFGVLTIGVGAQSTAALSVSETGLEYGAYTGLSGADIRVTIANIIRVVLGFLGTLALLIVLYGGFVYMTAAGVEERITRAKGILKSGIIGLVIIISAFAITSFVISRLISATDGSIGGGGSSAPAESACIGFGATCPAGSLGNGIVESHFPSRNATGIARNTRIVVTLKAEIEPTSLKLGGADATVAVIKSAAVGPQIQFIDRFADRLLSDKLTIVLTEDRKTFVIMQEDCPPGCIGSVSENVFYTVALRGGVSGVKLVSGEAAFTGTFNGGYLWEFQVSTVFDTTPPTVTFVSPADGTRENPRNSLIQMNFNEAIDPISVGVGIEITTRGSLIPGENLTEGTPIPGENLIGNGYRSVEFLSEELCGINSCGEQIFCLPGDARIKAVIQADALTANPPTGVFPPNGITDMAGNSLDGDGDGIAVGPSEDNFVFTFDTNDTIDLTPPVIISQQPGAGEGEIPRELRITASFSKLMSTTSLTTDSARLISGAPEAPTNYSVLSEHSAGGNPDRTKAIIRHDLLSVNQPYSAFYTSGIRDTRQNCFFPGAGPGCSDGDKYCCDGEGSDDKCTFLPLP